MSFRHINNHGGFFSDYFLGHVFGRGGGRGKKKRLSDRDTDNAYRRFKRLHAAVETRVCDAPELRERFARHLLRDLLGFHLDDGPDGLGALRASADDAARGTPPLALVYVGASGANLDASSERGAPAPMRRAAQALASAGVGHAFLVTDERIRLVRPEGDARRGSYLEADFDGLAVDDDPESFAAFLQLFRVSQYVPGADCRAPIALVEEESRAHAARVSEDLKRAVFTSAETLVGGLLRDAAHRGAETDVGEERLRSYRDAALMGLYRILFILYAEDRDPRLDEHVLYKQSYSIHGLVGDLIQDPLREWPENRSSLWARLKAVFRIFDKGLPAITPWSNIPPRGGDFFRTDTPEGRILEAATLPDRTVAKLLLDLTTTAPRRGVGRERVSFRELDIESLGAVYEGLLEFEPRLARETTIEAKVQSRVFALVPQDLVRLCREKKLAMSGDLALVEGTLAEELHPEAAEGDGDADDDDDEENEEDEDADHSAEGEESDDGEGVKKGATARLVRRLEPGDFHFVPGPARKGSGSFYTPLPLVQDVVRHAVGPFARNKGSADIERLRVLDPACGSAHFLVEVMRFLGRELHRAYCVEHGAQGPPAFRSTTGQGWDDNWRASDADARASNSEARAWCKRRIAERCLFGVDLNPMAVGLARVALWIESLAGDRPLSYFEHHVRCGNSLLGTWFDRLREPPHPDLGKAGIVAQKDLLTRAVKKKLEAAARERGLIEGASEQAALERDSLFEQYFKEQRKKAADVILKEARLLFDLRSAAPFLPDVWGEFAGLGSALSAFLEEKLDAYARSRPWWPAFEAIRDRERFFHWELEYPEVFLDRGRQGFDVVVGNPPWDEVRPKKHEFYARQDILIRAFTGDDLDSRIRELHDRTPGLNDAFSFYAARLTTTRALLQQEGDFPWSEAKSHLSRVDLSKYFVDRAARVVHSTGSVGLVVPSILYNGDACIGIRRHLLRGCKILRFYGFENRKKIFPIDSRYKFVNLVFRKGESADTFDATFMRHDLLELEREDRAPWMVSLSPKEIERHSPETLALLELRGPRDQDIIRRMAEGRPTLGSPSEVRGSWGAHLFDYLAHENIYNTTWDKDLWAHPETKRLHEPANVLKTVPSRFGETLQKMREKGFWPVFGGKQMAQHVIGRKPVRWWLSLDQVRAKYGKTPREEPLLVYRKVARDTDERTCMAVVLPRYSTATESLLGVRLEHVSPEGAAAVISSLCFDYAIRMRIGGPNLSFTYMKSVPVPPATAVRKLPAIETRLAWERPLDNVTQDQSVWALLWDIERAVAEAYDLTADDFEHVLSTFPGMAKKRRDFVAYLRERLAEWKGTPTAAAAGEPAKVPRARGGRGTRARE